MKVLRVLKLLKLTKILRLIRFMETIVLLQDALNLSNRSAAILKHCATFTLSIHWTACAFGFFTSTQFQSTSWVDTIDDLREEAAWQQYPYCLYFAISAFAMGETEATQWDLKLDIDHGLEAVAPCPQPGRAKRRPRRSRSRA